MFDGKDVLDIAFEHNGEDYVLGARAPLANKNWKGPWDCAEFTTWCSYQAYQIIFGAKPLDPMRADAYTGFWWDHAVQQKARCSVDEALRTPGAFLLRKPGAFQIKIGHIAISCGDGTTFEAKGKRDGVGHFPNAKGRSWSTGVLLPGIRYSSSEGTITHQPPSDLLMLTDPYTRGKDVKELQKALKEAGLNPGKIDGVFGPLTEVAVTGFQMREGLTVDGVVGPETRAQLGI